MNHKPPSASSTPNLSKASSRNPHFQFHPNEDSLNKVQISQIDVSSSLSYSGATNNAQLHKTHTSSPHNNSDTTTVKLSHQPLNSDKIFVVTIHSAKVQISSNILLRFTCQLNDSEIH